MLLLLAATYFGWWARDGDPELLTKKDEPKETKPEVWKPFLPAGWKVSEVREEVLTHVEIPHLHKKLVGKKVRIADIEGSEVAFSSSKPGEYRNTTLTRGRVILLAETEQLVRIELFETEVPAKVPGQVTLAVADSVYDSTDETYEGLAPETAPRSFQDILDIVGDRSVASVEKSRRIEASFLVYSQAGISDPQTVWAVTCYGFPGDASTRGVQRFRHLLTPEGKMFNIASRP